MFSSQAYISNLTGESENLYQSDDAYDDNRIETRKEKY